MGLMKIRQIFLSLSFLSLLSLNACSDMFKFDAFSPRLAIGAVEDLGKAAFMSDEEVKNMASGFANQSDQRSRIAPPNSSYAKRLRALTQKHTKEDGLDLNYKVYLTKDINAFAFADGSIRFYSGIMDMMNDDELLFIIGHEIGHVKHGHSKSKQQLAAASMGIRKGIASTNSIAGDIAASSAGGILDKLINMQFSQSNEYEADEYGVNFMKRHGYNVDGAITSFNKLATLERKGGTFSNLVASHPTSKKRADALAKLIGNDSSVQFAELSDEEDKNTKSDSEKSDSENNAIASLDENNNAPAENNQLASNFGSGSSHNSELNSEPEFKNEELSNAGNRNYKNKISSNNNSMGFSVIDTNKPNRNNSTKNNTKPNYESNEYKGNKNDNINKGWYIQVLASTNKSGANSASQKLKNLGFSSTEQSAEVHGRTYHRVLVGPFSSKMEAQDGIQSVRKSGVANEIPFLRYLSDKLSSNNSPTNNYKKESYAQQAPQARKRELERLSQLK